MENFRCVNCENRLSVLFSRSCKIHFKRPSSRVPVRLFTGNEAKGSEYNRGNHVTAIVDDLAGFDGTSRRGHG